jgi:hypothetical protein
LVKKRRSTQAFERRCITGNPTAVNPTILVVDIVKPAKDADKLKEAPLLELYKMNNRREDKKSDSEYPLTKKNAAGCAKTARMTNELVAAGIRHSLRRVHKATQNTIENICEMIRREMSALIPSVRNNNRPVKGYPGKNATLDSSGFCFLGGTVE